MVSKIKKLFKKWVIKSDLKGCSLFLEEINSRIYSDRYELNCMRSEIVHSEKERGYYDKQMKELNENIKLNENMRYEVKEKIKSLQVELNNLRNK